MTILLTNNFCWLSYALLTFNKSLYSNGGSGLSCTRDRIFISASSPPPAQKLSGGILTPFTFNNNILTLFKSDYSYLNHCKFINYLVHLVAPGPYLIRGALLLIQHTNDSSLLMLAKTPSSPDCTGNSITSTSFFEEVFQCSVIFSFLGVHGTIEWNLNYHNIFTKFEAICFDLKNYGFDFLIHTDNGALCSTKKKC